MSAPLQPDPQRLFELLAAEALGSLSAEEATELAELTVRNPQIDREVMQRVAAATHLALAPPPDEPLPDWLHTRIAAVADRELAGPQPASPPAPAAPTAGVAPASIPLWRRASFAWLVAAACLLLAIAGWQDRWPSAPAAPTPADLRERLLADAPDAMQLEWQPGKHPFDTPVVGDVVWSNERQEGYLRFTGMPPNDPSREQYQLWIVDPSRDERPVDGGVFNIPSGCEVVIPIRAKLQVLDPQAFAVTVEKPGGVVVSAQTRLPLLAAKS